MINETLSPIPPVECLSITGPDKSHSLILPVSRMAKVRSTRSRSLNPEGKLPWQRLQPEHHLQIHRRDRMKTPESLFYQAEHDPAPGKNDRMLIRSADDPKKRIGK